MGSNETTYEMLVRACICLHEHAFLLEQDNHPYEASASRYAGIDLTTLLENLEMARATGVGLFSLLLAEAEEEELPGVPFTEEQKASLEASLMQAGLTREEIDAINQKQMEASLVPRPPINRGEASMSDLVGCLFNLKLWAGNPMQQAAEDHE